MPATKEKPLPDFKSDDRPTWIAQGGVGPRIGQGPEGSARAGSDGCGAMCANVSLGHFLLDDDDNIKSSLPILDRATLLRLDVRKFHHLAPLLGFADDEPGKVGSRKRQWREPEIGKA